MVCLDEILGCWSRIGFNTKLALVLKLGTLQILFFACFLNWMLEFARGARHEENGAMCQWKRSIRVDASVVVDMSRGRRSVGSGGVRRGDGASCWRGVVMEEDRGWRRVGIGGRGGSVVGRGALWKMLNPEQYEGDGSILKIRDYKYSEYHLVLESNSNSKFLTIQTTVFGASQYQF